MMIVLNASAWSQDLDSGRTEFLSNCAACHGADAKGTGPLSARMKPKPTDLTIIAKSNNGVFSPDVVYKIIDGREARTSHRSVEMPVWGCRHPSQPILEGSGHRRSFIIPFLSRKNGHRRSFVTPSLSQRNVHKPATDPLGSLIDLPCDPEPVIRSRILAIVEYLSRIQDK